MRANTRNVIGQNVISAKSVKGDVVRLPRTSSADHAMSTAARMLAGHQRRRRPDAASAVAEASTPTSANERAPHAIAAAVLTGSRYAATSPMIAPITAPANAMIRSCLMAGPRTTDSRGTGALSSCMTTGASSTSGPPRPPERNPTPIAIANPRPSHIGASLAKLRASSLVSRLSGS